MGAMNETTQDPQGVDDPALLAEIEAEFAELTREIERISAMPRSIAPQKQQLVEALRASWRTRLDERGGKERPEWRQRLDTTIGKAIDRLLEDGIQENPDGSLGFALRGDTLQSEGGPVMRGLLEGFAHMLEERFPAPGKAPPPAPDAPPPNPLQALFGNLGHAFAGVLKTAIQNVNMTPQGATAKVGDGVDISATTSSDPSAAGTANISSKADFGFGGDQKLSTTFEFDSRTNTSVTPVEAEGTPPAPKSGAQVAAGAASNAFFQQLIAGFGQALKTAVTPKPTELPAAPPQPASATDVPPDATSPVGTTPPLGATSATTTPPASPLAGLGQLLSQALLRAMGPNAGPIVLQAAQPTTTPVPGAASAAGAPDPAGTTTADPHAATPTDAPPTSGSAPTSPAAEANTAAAPPEEPKAPTLQIDFAGLLAQLLGGGKKPPGT